MSATDAEITAALTTWSNERQNLAALQDRREALISQRVAITAQITALGSEIEAARQRAVTSRQALRDAMNPP